MVKRVALMIAGWMFLVLGAAGIFLPVLPGVLFLLIGLSILSAEYDWAHRWVSTLGRRFPAFDRKLQMFFNRRPKPTTV